MQKKSEFDLFRLCRRFAILFDSCTDLLLTAHLMLRNVLCVASKGMKLETVAQVNKSQEDKVEMVSLCSVGK